MVVMFAHINFVFIFAASNNGEVARLNEFIRAGLVGYLLAPKPARQNALAEGTFGRGASDSVLTSLTVYFMAR